MTMFQQRHYNAIAAVLKDAPDADTIRSGLVSLFIEDNERFNPVRFIEASMVRCEVQKCEQDATGTVRLGANSEPGSEVTWHVCGRHQARATMPLMDNSGE